MLNFKFIQLVALSSLGLFVNCARFNVAPESPSIGLMMIDLDPVFDVDELDPMVNIDEDTQNLAVAQARFKCELYMNEINLQHGNATSASKNAVCMPFFDSIKCWPLAQLNQTVVEKCPNYVNKFNRESMELNLFFLFFCFLVFCLKRVKPKAFSLVILKKETASKKCVLNATTNKAEWSKADYSKCEELPAVITKEIELRNLFKVGKF